MQKNLLELELDKIYTLNIDDLDMMGRGIAHLNEKTIFVENALKDEIVEAKIINKKSNFYFAITQKVLKQSLFRVNPICPYFSVCGGCDLQHLAYHQTLNFKKNQFLINLKKIANLSFKENEVEVVKSDNEYFYRNKVTFQVKNINNIARLCFYKKQSHDFVEIENCFICDKKIATVINYVNQFLKDSKVKAYDEKTKTGLVKNIVVRIIENKILLTIVVVKKCFLDVSSLFTNLTNEFLDVGINLNINKSSKDILSTNFIQLKGNNAIGFNIMNTDQIITNASFLQVNFNVQDKLYKYVLSKVYGDVVNAYSGAGLLTCLIAKNLYKSNIVGIEINKEATKFADKLVQTNNLSNVKNICGDASEEIKKIELNDYTLVVDPPRSGLSDEFIKSIMKNPPNTIIYISCSPQTICKNLLFLKEKYFIKEIKLFDMFAQTRNVETVVILNKK